MSIKNYAIDLGYGYTKACNDTKRIMFPSLHKPFLSTIDQKYDDIEYVVKIDNKQYAVGNYVLIQDKERELKKDHQLDDEKVSVFLGTALNLLSDDCSINEDINLSVGLPIDFYREQHGKVKNMLTGLKIKTEVNGKVKNFRINEVIVSQQAVSAFFTLYHNIDGTTKDSGLVDSKFGNYGGGIIDIGFNTLDLLRVSGKQSSGTGKFAIIGEKSRCYEGLGAVYAHKLATEDLNYRLQFDRSTTFYEKFMNSNGMMPISGKMFDIKPYFEEAYSILADEIEKTILNLWDDVASFGGLYMTGGTAEKIIPHLTNIKNIDIKLQEDPMFANALGLLVKLNRAFPVVKKEMAGVSGGNG